MLVKSFGMKTTIERLKDIYFEDTVVNMRVIEAIFESARNETRLALQH